MLRQTGRPDSWLGIGSPRSTPTPEEILTSCQFRNKVAGLPDAAFNKPETMPFLTRSPLVRADRNVSASSSSNTHPHVWASWKLCSRFASTSGATVPRSAFHGLEICGTLCGWRLTYRMSLRIEGVLSKKRRILYKSVSIVIQSDCSFLVFCEGLPAVRVLPVPGAPCNNIINPCPI